MPDEDPKHELVGTKITVPLELTVINGPEFVPGSSLVMRNAPTESEFTKGETGEVVGFFGATFHGIIVAGVADYQLVGVDQLTVWRAIEEKLLEHRDIWQEKKDKEAAKAKRKEALEEEQKKKPTKKKK